MGSTQTFVAISFNLKGGIGGVVASDDILTRFPGHFLHPYLSSVSPAERPPRRCPFPAGSS